MKKLVLATSACAVLAAAGAFELSGGFEAAPEPRAGHGVSTAEFAPAPERLARVPFVDGVTNLIASGMREIGNAPTAHWIATVHTSSLRGVQDAAALLEKSGFTRTNRFGGAWAEGRRVEFVRGDLVVSVHEAETPGLIVYTVLMDLGRL
jgi:hypothetical protein